MFKTALSGNTFLIFSVLLSVGWAIYDWWVLRRRYIYSKTSRVAIRGFKMLAFSLYMHQNNALYLLMLGVGLSMGLQAAIFWLLFDFLLNIFRGKPWLYSGSVGMLDPTIGRHDHVEIIVKLCLIVIFYHLYFTIFSFW
jgi:hypothetical protein